MDEEATKIKTSLASLHNIYVADRWLKICIDWCKQVLLGPDYTLEQLERNVYEQWLMIDLRDLERPCLPPKLSSREDFTLNGNFFLQVMELVDLSKPKLWQLQRIRNEPVLTKGTQQESADITIATRKRKLQLTLSDGVQEVEAIERSPIPSLSINLLPGAKLWVLGPVVVKRGRLMLERHNVKVLGGDVLKLRVSNHPENVLARSLKLPENPKPGTIDEKVLYGEPDREEAIMTVCDVNEPKPFRNNHLPSKRSYQSSILPTDASSVGKHEEDRISIDNNIMMLEARRDINEPLCKKTKTAAHFFVDEDVDKVDRLVISKLLEKRIDYGKLKIKAKLKFTVEKRMTEGDNELINRIEENTSDFFDKLDQLVKCVSQNVDDDVFNDIDTLLDNMEIHKSQDQKCPSVEKLLDRKILTSEKPPIYTTSKLLEKTINCGNLKIKAKLKFTGDYKLMNKIEENASDFFYKLVTCSRPNPTEAIKENKFVVPKNFDADLEKIENQSQDRKPPSREKASDRKCLSTKKPPIFTISQLLAMRTDRGYFKCKITFKCIMEKLAITEDQYRLIIKVEDYTSDMIIKLNSNIISSYAGYAPADMLAFKSSSKFKQDKSAANKVMKAMQNVKENLLKLHNTIVIIQMREGEMPVIVEIIE